MSIIISELIEVPQFFRSGMSSTVNFMMEGRIGALYLPSNAVKKRGKRSYAFKQVNGEISAAQIETGLESGDKIEIISGMSEGEDAIIPTQKIAQDTLERRQFRQPINPFGKRNR